MLLKNTLIISITLGYLLSFHSAFAENEVDISLKATINNNPAFKPVTWKLFRVGDETKPIMTGSRHSMTFKMKPGFYKVIAVMGEVQRDKQFTVAPRVSREILVSMD